MTRYVGFAVQLYLVFKKHNRQKFGALLQSIIGNFKRIIGSNLVITHLFKFSNPCIRFLLEFLIIKAISAKIRHVHNW